MALALARRGEGLTRPNPPVGAVVVKGGRMIGSGFHRKAGGPHAEVLALRKAGRRARGATLYVTLEPCSTWGRTPPCTDAVLASGVKQVVVSLRDPNPRHAGRGLTLLKRAGVSVVDNVLADESRELLAPFAKWIATRRPFVTLKLGISLDGRIADRTGRSRWITGAKARQFVQGLRRRSDAVMVGANTVRIDNPSLLPRPARGRKPYRVIITHKGRLPASARVLTDDAKDQTLIAYCGGAGGTSLSRLMSSLGALGILRVLCEGGGELAASLIQAKLVDEFIFFVAPCFVGGRGSVGAVGGRGWRMNELPRVRITSAERIGEDIMIRAVPA